MIAQPVLPQALGTGDSPQFANVNIGAAADTTITRVAAGVIAVEGATLATLSDVSTAQAACQPVDSDLTAIAALATTSFGRGLLTIANAAALAGNVKLDECAAPTDVTTLNASSSAHGLLRKLSNVSTEYLSGTGVFSTPAGSGGSISSSSNYITTDVTMTASGTYYDGPSLTLAVGTYLLVGAVQILASSTANREFTVKLWDGTTANTLVACKSSGTAQSFKAAMPVHALVVIASGTPTWKISATSSVNADTLLGTSPADKASYLIAIKIA